MADLLDIITAPVTGIFGDLLKRLLPEKVSEEEKIKLTQEFALKLREYDWSEFNAEIQDRANARALAMKELEKGNALTNVLAAIHRPIWSFLTMGLFAATVLGPVFGTTFTMTADQWGIINTVIKFYFGGRTLEKVVNMVTESRPNGGNGKSKKETVVDVVADRILARQRERNGGD